MKKYKPSKAVQEIQNNEKLENELLKIYRANLDRIRLNDIKWSEAEEVDAKLDVYNHLKSKGIECNSEEDRQDVWNCLWASSRNLAIIDGDYDEEYNVLYWKTTPASETGLAYVKVTFSDFTPTPIGITESIALDISAEVVLIVYSLCHLK